MYELHVDGMTCGGCANSVKRSIQAIDSVAKVEVDLASKKVRVDTQSSIDDVSAAVTGAGYEVVSAQVA
jgi:copper chaperone